MFKPKRFMDTNTVSQDQMGSNRWVVGKIKKRQMTEYFSIRRLLTTWLTGGNSPGQIADYYGGRGAKGRPKVRHTHQGNSPGQNYKGECAHANSRAARGR